MMSGRRLCLKSFDAIGFDMDGVLAKYNYQAFVSNIYGLLVKHLVSHKGHKAEVFPEFDKVKSFCGKGVVIDACQGNLFKCGAQGNIFRACHGTKILNQSEIKQYYPDGKWTDYATVANNLGIRGDYAFIESLYEMPVPALFALLVKDLDVKSKTEPNRDQYKAALTHIWEAVRFIYSPAPTWPTDEPVTFFEYGSEHPEQFVVPCSAEIRQWLRTLKEEGRTVYLLTSSYAYFTKSVLQYILGSDYEEYFDFFLCQAGKPNFFRPSCAIPFSQIDPVTMDVMPGEVSSFQDKAWYRAGNLLQLNTFLREKTCKKNIKMLYIGDGIKNDIWPSKHFAKWDTAYILEDMLLPENSEEKAKMSDDDREFLSSPLWGSYLSDGDQETLASSVIRSQADIALPLLDYFTDLPLDHEFISFDPNDLTSSGYYPAKPVTAV